ncbi:hypothetical protein IE53DRAFT_247100 [Violaceomyces palustris]|uniref:Uncharacterized protein n=1 Tax=Violaceomyces palustris TaxID=1673888 RepID=A0ACD0NP16_9BASI|nr:hypothetical protein IE53DRAFT_247100 [Violaceomyces palustris]
MQASTGFFLLLARALPLFTPSCCVVLHSRASTSTNNTRSLTHPGVDETNTHSRPPSTPTHPCFVSSSFLSSSFSSLPFPPSPLPILESDFLVDDPHLIPSCFHLVTTATNPPPSMP